MKKIKSLIYLPWWFFRARFLGRKAPLQTVLFISEKCNLECKHCNIYNNKNPHIKSIEQIEKELIYSYKLGSRFVDFEGGEPFLWRDKQSGKNINDLVDLAKKIGFFSATVTTNAQLPFNDSKADSIWISLDGIGQYHDNIRGKGAFERLLKNLDENNHKHLSFNMAINTINYNSVEETIKFAKNHPKIKSIALNFHTPFPGTEDLFLNTEQRIKTIDLIIDMKKQGYPIMNSISGLKLMKHNKFKKHCWVSNFIMSDGTKFEECQGKTLGVCDKCGFCMAGEMNSVFNFKPDTIFAGIKLRV